MAAKDPSVPSSRRKPFPWTRATLLVLVVVTVLLTIFPFLWLLQMSLKTGIEAFLMPPKLLFIPTLQNYLDLLEGKFMRSFWNSSVVGVSTTLISLLLGVPAAYALSRAGFRREPSLSLWILTT